MRRPAVLLAAALLVALASGCSDDGDDRGQHIDVGPAVDLTRSGGCGDVFIWASTDDGTTAVAVGVVFPRHSTREPVELAVDVTDPAVEAVLLRGDGDVTANLCSDLVDPGSEPTEEVPLASGAGTVTVDPIPTDVPLCTNATGRMELEDVVAEDGTVLGTVTAETTAVGCTAG